MGSAWGVLPAQRPAQRAGGAAALLRAVARRASRRDLRGGAAPRQAVQGKAGGRRQSGPLPLAGAFRPQAGSFAGIEAQGAPGGAGPGRAVPSQAVAAGRVQGNSGHTRHLHRPAAVQRSSCPLQRSPLVYTNPLPSYGLRSVRRGRGAGPSARRENRSLARRKRGEKSSRRGQKRAKCPEDTASKRPERGAQRTKRRERAFSPAAACPRPAARTRPVGAIPPRAAPPWAVA